MTDPKNTPPEAKGNVFFSILMRVALPMFLALSDQSIIGTALPSIVSQLGQPELLSLVVVGYLATVTIVAPIYGRFGDAFGRRRMLLIALAIFAAGGLICALAQSMPMLVAGRILQGAGGGGVLALVHALFGEQVPPRVRARYQGYFATILVTSNAAGPVMGGLLADAFGWRAIFYCSVPMALISMALIATLPRGMASGRQKFDFPGLILFALFVVSLLAALNRVQGFTEQDFLMAGMLGLAALLALWSLARFERRAKPPFLPVDLFGNPTIWRAVLVAAAQGGIVLGLLTIVPLHLRLVHGISASEIGIMVAPIAIGTAFGSMITGLLVSHTGRTAIFPSWGLAVVASILTSIAVLLPSITPVQLAVMLGIMATFGGSVMSVVQVTVLAATGAARIGDGAAAIQYCRSLGGAVVTALASCALFLGLSLSGGVDPETLVLAMASAGPEAGSAGVVMLEAILGGQMAFGLLALTAATASFLMWTMPLRRI